MAVIALKELEDQLSCSICLDTYSSPKQLQCHHVYCQQCLVRLVDKDIQGQLVLPCPNCRQITPIPTGGVASLQPAFHINQLLEIVKVHKKERNDGPEVGSADTDSASHPTLVKDTTHCCPVHSGREMELYCQTCETLICLKCIMKNEQHHSHDYEEVDEALEKFGRAISSSLEPMKAKLGIIGSAMEGLDSCCAEISGQRESIEAEIYSKFENIHSAVDVRKAELMGQLHKITETKLKTLAAQRDQLETTQAQLRSCIHFICETLKSNSDREVLQKRRTTLSLVKELTAALPKGILKPHTEANTLFSAPEDLVEKCASYGRVLVISSPDPSECWAMGSGIVSATVGEQATATVRMMNYKNEPCTESTESITCELVSEVTGLIVTGSVEHVRHNRYEISYQPSLQGRHQLHITVEGQHIRGSPFHVTASPPVHRSGVPILSIRGVDGPEGIAISPARGEVVISEYYKDCISVYSRSGKKLWSFRCRGSNCGQFKCPCGLTVDSNGSILVADSVNHRIQKFSARGRFLASVGERGCKPLKFNLPYGISYNSFNDRVYVGDENCNVQILDSDLNYVSHFGEKGSGKGQFIDPRHITCDNTGNVYVADCGNHRIQVFTGDGVFLRMFGSQGEREGEFDKPYGVAVNSDGTVSVSEVGNKRVSVFTSDSEFLTSFGQKGAFAGLSGLAVDNSGVTYVCDFANSCVLML